MLVSWLFIDSPEEEPPGQAHTPWAVCSTLPVPHIPTTIPHSHCCPPCCVLSLVLTASFFTGLLAYLLCKSVSSKRAENFASCHHLAPTPRFVHWCIPNVQSNALHIYGMHLINIYLINEGMVRAPLEMDEKMYLQCLFGCVLGLLKDVARGQKG